MIEARLRKCLPIAAGFVVLFFLCFSFYVYHHDIDSLKPAAWWSSKDYSAALSANDTAAIDQALADDAHPIAKLIRRADADFDALLRKETWDLGAAARRYREKRGRHPPPGFDQWHAYAKDNNAIVVEEFWDQIYDDLTPLWALDQGEMLRDVRAQSKMFTIRQGRAMHGSDPDHFWMPIWEDLLNEIAFELPDMDLAMNTMDEPRLLVPWETIDEYVTKEQESRKMLPLGNVEGVYTAPPPQVNATVEFPWSRDRPIWKRAAAACPPDSPARISPTQTDYSQPPVLSTEHMLPHLTKGYVSNYTLSTSICHQPDLQGLHGFFIEAISSRLSEKLVPMFGSSKLTVNNEILVPATMYYKGDSRFISSSLPTPWDQKMDELVWRGLASGGRNKVDNWKGFHRHRLVSMLNGTQALAMPNNSGFIDIASLPLQEYNLQSLSDPTQASNEAIGTWLQNFTDVAFNDLSCFPKEDPPRFGCDYTDYIFKPLDSIPLPEQYKRKYLVDVDGNSFSGRYLDFLLSTSLPIKATLFREWHDSRLMAWKHFVPMDNRFLDFYGIMEFFLGRPVGSGRDFAAGKIALQGREWAQRVLRKEDMRVYMYRLLLEYARVMDQKRDSLGWVGDGGQVGNEGWSKGSGKSKRSWKGRFWR